MHYKLLGPNLDCKVKKGAIGTLQRESVRILSSGMQSTDPSNLDEPIHNTVQQGVTQVDHHIDARCLDGSTYASLSHLESLQIHDVSVSDNSFTRNPNVSYIRQACSETVLKNLLSRINSFSEPRPQHPTGHDPSNAYETAMSSELTQQGRIENRVQKNTYLRRRYNIKKHNTKESREQSHKLENARRGTKICRRDAREWETDKGEGGGGGGSGHPARRRAAIVVRERDCLVWVAQCLAQSAVPLSRAANRRGFGARDDHPRREGEGRRHPFSLPAGDGSIDRPRADHADAATSQFRHLSTRGD